MADDIEIQVGGDSVRVPRWATEETIQRLYKTNEDLARALKKYFKGGTSGTQKPIDSTKVFQGLKDTINQSQTAGKKHSQGEVKRYEKLKKATDKIEGTAKTVSEVLDKNTLRNAAAALASIPLVGGAAAFAVNQLETFSKNLTQLTNVGVGLGTTLIDLRQQASATGLNMEDYSNLVVSNGEALRAMGENAQDGARRFSQLSQQVRVNAREFNNFGLTNSEFNEILLEEIEMRRRAGMEQRELNEGLSETMNRLMTETTALATITGQDRREMLRQRREMMEDPTITAFRLSLEKAGGRLSENFDSLATAFGAGGEVGRQLGMAIAQSVATGLDFRAVNQGAFAQIASLNQNASVIMNEISDFVKTNMETMPTREFNARITAMLAELGESVPADELKNLGRQVSTGVEGAAELVNLIAELQGLETNVKKTNNTMDQAVQNLRDSSVLAFPATIEEMTNRLKESALTTVIGDFEDNLEDAADALLEKFRTISENFGVESGIFSGLTNSYMDLTDASNKLTHAFYALLGAVGLGVLSRGGRGLMGRGLKAAGRGTVAAAGGGGMLASISGGLRTAVKSGLKLGGIGALISALNPSEAANATVTGNWAGNNDADRGSAAWQERRERYARTRFANAGPLKLPGGGTTGPAANNTSAFNFRAEDRAMSMAIPDSGATYPQNRPSAISQSESERIMNMLQRNGWFENGEQMVNELRENNRVLRRILDETQNQ